MCCGPAIIIGPVQQRGGQSLQVGAQRRLTSRLVAEEDTQRVHLARAHGCVEAGAAVLQGTAEQCNSSRGSLIA